MKRIILLAVLIISLMFGTAYASESIKDVFPDENFRAVVCDAAGIDDDTDSFSAWKEEISGITQIHAPVSGISSLDGIENLTELKVLDISGNEVETLEIAALTKLEILIADNCRFENVDLRKNTKLKSVYLQNCMISRLKLPSGVEKLYVYGNKLTGVDISSCENLSELNLSENSVNEIDLKGNTSLGYLWLNDNRIWRISLPVTDSFKAVNLKNQRLAVGVKKDSEMSFGEKIMSSSVPLQNGKLPVKVPALPEDAEVYVSVDGYMMSGIYSFIDFRGDVTSDGVINNEDLSLMLGKYRMKDSVCDIDNGGIISVDDISILLSSYGKTADIILR